jgi:D-methionine transport system substrate-binding protein
MKRRHLLAGAAFLLARPTLAAVPGEIRIGVAAGPQAELLAHARELAAAQGLSLTLDVREHGDGFAADLARGTLDAAAWTDGVRFADESHRARTPLAVAAGLFTLPTGLYSRTLTSVHRLRDGDAVAIPADASGQARALVLLQNSGLIVLRDDSGLHARLRDVVENRRGLRLVALPAPRLFDALARMPLVAMDYDTASRAGLQPARDSIGIEDARTPFGGVLGVRRDRLAQPWLAQLVGVVHGEPMKHFALERFHDSVRRPW